MSDLHPWISHFDLILFDFDGLLVDTEIFHYESYKIALSNRGYALPWDFPRYMQAAMRATHSQEIYALFPSLKKEAPDWDVIRKEKNPIYEELLETKSIPLMPGVEKLLALLKEKKVRHAIVTNSTRSELEIISKNLPIIQSIPHWITRDLYDRPKPAQDPYLCALETLGKKGDRIVAFEDALKGIEAIKGTGIHPILICEKNHPQFYESAPSCQHFNSFTILESRPSISIEG